LDAPAFGTSLISGIVGATQSTPMGGAQMRKFHLAAAAVTISCALMLVTGVGSASAQETTLPFAQKVPVTGEAKNGKQFKGTYTIDRFVARKGETWAVGTLKGRLKHRRVKREDVRMPASIAAPAQSSQVPVPTPGACSVLNLVLGPIDLNLLGLRVATNDIHLLIEAIPGQGNLLGNLLCAITNLLNPSANTPLAQLTQVLNALLALAPRTPAAAG
jgi:hypothetical protein